jgi:hypothetical protein
MNWIVFFFILATLSSFVLLVTEPITFVFAVLISAIAAVIIRTPNTRPPASS